MDSRQSEELYSPLDLNVVAKNDGILPQDNPMKDKYLSAFIQRHAPANRVKNELHQIQQKAFFLAKKQQKAKFKLPRSKEKKLSSAEKKRLKVFDIKPEEQRFSMFEPLHQLWKDYIADLIQVDRVNPHNLSNVEAKLLRTDFHGAFVSVTRSKCPSLIGLSGIVIQETRNVFKIISEDDRVRTIPKENTVFTLQHSGLLLTIYGNQFCVRASDRATKKFKAKSTTDL